MGDVREFLVKGCGWETIVELDISEFADFPPPVANRKIREEVARRGVEWFKSQPSDNNLEVSIMLDVYEHKPEMHINDYIGPFNHFGGFLLEDSAHLKNKRDVWIGRASPYVFNKKSLQEGSDTEKPDQIYP